MMVQLSERMLREDFQGEFVQMMLKAAGAPEVLSFAGGLPNPISFPAQELAQATQEVLLENGNAALQYGASAGYAPLRKYIAARYEKEGVAAHADEILITNGSQQALDMLAAVLLNEGETVLVENPSYLSALQTFHLYGASIHTVEMNGDGILPDALSATIAEKKPKFAYVIPNFQNPTGLTYTRQVREAAAEVVRRSGTLLVEDDPYGALRFTGQAQPSFATFLGEQCLRLGTFSKTVSPGMRIGWIWCRNQQLREALLRYKQIVDLHTGTFGQMVLCRYLETHDLDTHLKKITALYKHQSDVMLSAMARYFPAEVVYTRPEGGMFLWVTLPEGYSAVELGQRALRRNVAIAPGDPFYEKRDGVIGAFRLNYTNCGDAAIEKGIAILGEEMRAMMR